MDHCEKRCEREYIHEFMRLVEDAGESLALPGQIVRGERAGSRGREGRVCKCTQMVTGGLRWRGRMGFAVCTHREQLKQDDFQGDQAQIG